MNRWTTLSIIPHLQVQKLQARLRLIQTHKQISSTEQATTATAGVPENLPTDPDNGRVY
jgi:hypothetical protein